MPHRIKTVTVEADDETVAWFEAQGETAAKRMRAAPQIYAKAHEGEHMPA